LRKEQREIIGFDLLQTVAGRAGSGLNRETSSPKLKLVLLSKSAYDCGGDLRLNLCQNHFRKDAFLEVSFFFKTFLK
jgi:hypothetical protein